MSTLILQPFDIDSILWSPTKFFQFDQSFARYSRNRSIPPCHRFAITPNLTREFCHQQKIYSNQPLVLGLELRNASDLNSSIMKVQRKSFNVVPQALRRLPSPFEIVRLHHQVNVNGRSGSAMNRHCQTAAHRVRYFAPLEFPNQIRELFQERCQSSPSNCQLCRELNHVLQQIRFVIRLHALQHDGEPFQSHASID